MIGMAKKLTCDLEDCLLTDAIVQNDGDELVIFRRRSD